MYPTGASPATIERSYSAHTTVPAPVSTGPDAIAPAAIGAASAGIANAVARHPILANCTAHR
jgi:hypothetical protein